MANSLLRLSSSSSSTTTISLSLPSTAAATALLTATSKTSTMCVFSLIYKFIIMSLCCSMVSGRRHSPLFVEEAGGGSRRNSKSDHIKVDFQSNKYIKQKFWKHNTLSSNESLENCSLMEIMIHRFVESNTGSIRCTRHYTKIKISEKEVRKAAARFEMKSDVNSMLLTFFGLPRHVFSSL
uniref:Uncharacterized protein n=1 Tax=Glossina pallidipes TaxID=7398 RepID=A0A1A9ZID3_GLOPL